MGRRAFGQIRKLPSGKYQARYQADATGRMVNGPTTFSTKAAAEAWLRREAVRLEQLVSGAPAPKRTTPTFAQYSTRWLAERPLRPSTARTYRHYLNTHVLRRLGPMRLDAITPEVIRAWHRSLAPDAPTVRARTYALVKTILASAVDEDLIDNQPCRIRGASNARVQTEVVIATPEQVDALYRAMPPRLGLAVLFGAWCQLRVGETLALRRRDVDTVAEVVHVRRGVTWQGRTPTYGPPKTAAGERAVHMPEAMLETVRDHLEHHVGPGPDDLLFPAKPGAQHPIHLSTFSTGAVKTAVRRTTCPRPSGSTTYATPAPRCSPDEAGPSPNSRGASATPPPASPCGTSNPQTNEIVTSLAGPRICGSQPRFDPDRAWINRRSVICQKSLAPSRPNTGQAR